MKELKILLIIGLLFIPYFAVAQCKSFVKENVIPKLEKKYIHDGHFNTATFEEGEEAELFKTFFKGQSYRLVVCSDENLPDVEFKVTDLDGKVYFDNKKDHIETWDFDVEMSQKLIIAIHVPQETGDDPASGCVAILIGLKNQ